MSTRLELTIVTDTDGSRINLAALSIPAANSLVVFIQSLAEIISSTPNNSDVRISVAPGSAKVVANGPDSVMDVMERNLIEVASNRSHNPTLVHSWKKVQSLLKTNGLGYEVNVFRGSNATSFTDSFKNSRAFRVRAQRNISDTELKFIKGRLIAVGGVVPNFHIQKDDDTTIVIKCDEHIATKIKVYLYRQIRISAWCHQIPNKRPTYTFCDKYIHEEDYQELKNLVQQINDGPASAGFILLHNILKNYLDRRRFGNVRKIVRLYNHTSVDVGLLKSILVITKNMNLTPGLRDDIEAIKFLLERKLGHELK